MLKLLYMQNAFYKSMYLMGLLCGDGEGVWLTGGFRTTPGEMQVVLTCLSVFLSLELLSVDLSCFPVLML